MHTFSLIMVSKILSILLLCASIAHGADYTLPAANQGSWAANAVTGVGVVGGIDQYRAGGTFARGAEGGGTTIDVTLTPYFADKTGATDASADINAAILAASPGDLVWIPAGTYRCDNAIVIYHDDDGVTVRGAGPGLTIIDGRNTAGIGLGAGGAFTASTQTVTGTGGSAGSWPKGATVLNVADSSAYVAGYLAKIYIQNEDDNTRIDAGAAPSISVFGFEKVRAHTVRVMSVAAGAITIDPPLPVDCANCTLEIALETLAHWRLEKCGVEDLTITGVNGSLTSALQFNYTDQCWAYNVATASVNNYPCNNADSYRTEIRYCAWDGKPAGSNGAGILWNTCSSGLIVDNIIKNSFPFIEENFGSMNNVWAYNFCGGISMVMNANHGPHNLLNLYEGNVVQGIQVDGYFGSASHGTLYRNWLHAQFEGAQRNALSFNRFTRNFVVAGNVMGWDGTSAPLNSYGNPNLGNSDFIGTATPSTGTFWADWKMTGTLLTRTSDTQAVVTVSSLGNLAVGQGLGNNGPSLKWAGGRRGNMAVIAISGLNVTFGVSGYDGGDVLPATSTALTIATGTSGFQESDADVELSTVKVENYEAAAVGTGSLQDGTADTLPNSLSFSGTPSWWTDDGFAGTYPPVNPNSPNWDIETIIPAAARYYDVAPSPGGGSITTGTLNVGTLNVGG